MEKLHNTVLHCFACPIIFKHLNYLQTTSASSACTHSRSQQYTGLNSEAQLSGHLITVPMAQKAGWVSELV
jgi:hypothetical protein